MAEDFDLNQYKETSPPPKFDLDQYKEVAPAAPDLNAPNRSATRRNAQAQPGITPELRAASPINKGVLKTLDYAPTVATIAAPGLDFLSGAGTAASLGSTLYGAGKATVKPLVRGSIGAAAGGYGGRELGGLVGFPEVGEKAGALLGGLYGAMGGKVPTKASLFKSVLEEEPPVRAPESIPQESMPPRGSSVGAPILNPTTTPPPEPKPLSNAQLGRNIEAGVKEAAGTPTLRPGVSLRNQPTNTVGAKTVTAEPNIEVSGPRIQTPARSETLTEAMKNRIPGSNPLERRTTLVEQPISPMRTAAQPAEETVPKLVRQSIHVNGARATEAALHEDPATLQDLLNLEGEQLREVLRKSGEDMTHIQTVGKSPGSTAGTAPGSARIAADPNNISRGEAIDILMDKGYTPEQISKEAPPRTKPAPHRTLYDTPEELEKYRNYVKKYGKVKQ